MSKKIAKVIFFDNGNTAVFGEDGQQIAELQDSWFNFEKVRELASKAGKDGADVSGEEVLPNDDFNFFFREAYKKGKELKGGEQ